MKHAIAASNAEQRQELKTAHKLARDFIVAACRDARLAGQIELLDGVPVSSLNQDVYKLLLWKLAEIATTDTAERVYENQETGEVKVVTVPNPRQLQAIEIGVKLYIAEGELNLKARELEGNERHPERAQVLVVNSADISRLSEMQRTAATGK